MFNKSVACYLLQDAGKVMDETTGVHEESLFEKNCRLQNRLFESGFERLLNQIESRNKQGKVDV